MPRFCFRKKGESTYYAKLTVPIDVRHIIGKSVFKQTTGTSDSRIAGDRALSIVAGWKEEIEKARNAGANLISDIRYTRSELAETIKQADEITVNKILSLPNPFPGETPSRPPNIPTFLKMIAETAIKEDRLLELAAIFKKHNSEYPSKGKLIDLYQEVFEFYFTLQNDRISTILFDNGLSKDIELSKAPATPTLLSTSQIGKYTDYRLKTGITSGVADNDKRRLIRLFKELGSNPTQQQVQQWFDNLECTAASMDKYLRTFNTYALWLPAASSVFADIKIKTESKKEMAARGKESFTLEQLQILFSSTKPAAISLRPLMLCALYTGARIAELCDLKIENIKITNGIRVIDIKDSKTVAGIRCIPIHSQLEQVIDELISASKNEYLFNNLSTNKGERSKLYGKRFSDLKIDLGFDKRVSFHSFRHTFATALANLDIPERIIQHIVGHERTSFTFKKYAKSEPLVKMKEAIEKLDYQF
ncbi:site-specific integrase [Azomonas macrocytogenes]|uniref:Integrase n=1 Tax=Azomonas macrocytogenes TaxID=69962 RepID=A0A839T4E1_AZOMA|nr:site-specific integrase [Azomonas macrocytogenes]MBB3104401.1 integrase [Azomonas macrocytogenes]